MSKRNSDAFLGAFSTIENALKKLLAGNKHTTFSELVHHSVQKSAVVRRYKAELQALGDLRNAIVHNRIGHDAIAEPHNKVVEQIQTIADKLVSPPTVMSRFEKPITTYKSTDPIRHALTHMHQYSYSQVVIVDNSVVCNVLTANTITRWLGLKVAEELVDLSETPIQEVLTAAEFKDNFKLIPKTLNCYEAIELFQSAHANGQPLDVLLISEHGRKTEQVLGIITPYQMPDLIETVG